MEIQSFSSVFELLAGLNIAFAGIQSFREQMVLVITQLATTKSARTQLEELRNIITVLEFEEPEGEYKVKFSNYLQKLRMLEMDARRVIAEYDENFLERNPESQPMFFVGFTFCFVNLCFIAFQQFLPSNFPIVIAEQILFVTLIYILILFFLRPSRYQKIVASPWVQIVFFAIITLIIVLFSFVAFRFSGFAFPEWVIMASAVFIALSPFFFESLRVHFYILKRTKHVLRLLESINEIVESGKRNILTDL